MGYDRPYVRPPILVKHFYYTYLGVVVVFMGAKLLKVYLICCLRVKNFNVCVNVLIWVISLGVRLSELSRVRLLYSHGSQTSRMINPLAVHPVFVDEPAENQ